MSTTQISINFFLPHSPQFLLDKYEGLRDADKERDKAYSPLHDGILSAIAENLKEYCPKAFTAAWTSSMFPERLTKEILRLVEQQIIVIQNQA